MSTANQSVDTIFYNGNLQHWIKITQPLRQLRSVMANLSLLVMIIPSWQCRAAIPSASI